MFLNFSQNLHMSVAYLFLKLVMIFDKLFLKTALNLVAQAPICITKEILRHFNIVT